MTTLHVAGFVASLFIGVSLGLMGGGGSILTLPVLVYLLGIDPIVSVTYSMFIVGTTSLVGSVSYMRQQQVNYKAALSFALPSFLTIYLTRAFLVPAIPDPVFATDTVVMSKNVGIMVFFGLVMLGASTSMIRSRRLPAAEAGDSPSLNWAVIVLDGGLVGVLTGIVGAGGGFLIIPALVLLARLPMKVAVGTSLLIIAANSLLGFRGNAIGIAIDWPFLLEFTALSVVGIFLGTYLTRFIPGYKLKKAFGWFVLIMGIYIIGHELMVARSG